MEAIHFSRSYVRKVLANALYTDFLEVYQRCSQPNGEFSVDAEAVAERSLKNSALAYMMQSDSDAAVALALVQFEAATNMTDELSALTVLVNSEHSKADEIRDRVLLDFYQRWKEEALVVNQWLTTQAISPLQGGLERVKALMQHESFDMKNPNKVRSVIGAFCANNSINFHRADGLGYQFLVEQITLLNTLNPQIASRQLTPLTKWRKYDPQRQVMMRQSLQQILDLPNLSKDVFEVVSKSLKE